MVLPQLIIMFPKYDSTQRSELLEIQIPANSTATRFNIPDQPQLRTDSTQDVVVQAIESYTIVDLALSPNNVPVVSSANFKQTYLVLYVDGEESIFRMPLTDFHVLSNGTDAFRYKMLILDNRRVDWTKSYFLTPAAYGGGVFATFSFLLNVHYRKLPPGTMGKVNQIEYLNYCRLQVPTS